MRRLSIVFKVWFESINIFRIISSPHFPVGMTAVAFYVLIYPHPRSTKFAFPIFLFCTALPSVYFIFCIIELCFHFQTKNWLPAAISSSGLAKCDFRCIFSPFRVKNSQNIQFVLCVKRSNGSVLELCVDYQIRALKKEFMRVHTYH